MTEHELQQREDALAFCEVCKCGECELAQHCPGEPLSEGIREGICRGDLNYVHGTWYKKGVKAYSLWELDPNACRCGFHKEDMQVCICKMPGADEFTIVEQVLPLELRRSLDTLRRHADNGHVWESNWRNAVSQTLVYLMERSLGKK